MTVKLHLFLIAIPFCAIGGCQKQDPVIEIAKKDFIGQYPKIEIVESGVRSRATDRIVVYLRYIRTPVTSYPGQAGIYEDEIGYMISNGEWRVSSVKGGKYIGPAKWIDRMVR